MTTPINSAATFLHVLLLLLALICAWSIRSHSAEGHDFIGQSIPEVQSAQPTAEMPNMSSVILLGPSNKRIADILRKAKPDQQLGIRGTRDIEIYKNAAPSVVLVFTEEGVGSGVYIRPGLVLTNWHVVANHAEVGIFFKPKVEGTDVDASSVIRAKVVRKDATKDLALLELAVAPKVRPLELGSEAEIQIGADVSAIGHPTGEAWTYTRGLVSQVRKNYKWETEGVQHQATVVQTQTPINPGNSGGPLLSEAGKLLGINSFKASGENLNFALSVMDVALFLQSDDKIPPAQKSCVAKRIYEGRNSSNNGSLVQMDTDCDGKVDITIVNPDAKSRARAAMIDSNSDGKVDIVIEDTQRDGRWDVSYHDVDFDGKVDLVGSHPDGKMSPSEYHKYG